MAKTKKTKTKSSPACSVILQVNNKKYQAVGDTVFDALCGLDKGIFPIKTKAVIEITEDKRKGTFPMFPLRLRAILNNSTSKLIWAKRFSISLK